MKCFFCFWKKKFVSLKKTLKNFFVIGTHRGRFQFIVILTPYGVYFHPVVVIGLGKNLLFKSVLAHCDYCMQKLWKSDIIIMLNYLTNIKCFCLRLEGKKKSVLKTIITLRFMHCICNYSLVKKLLIKLEKISKGSLDLIPSPSVKIQIMGGKVYSSWIVKIFLGAVNKLFVLPYYLK